MKKLLSEVGYFSKIAEIFITALTTQSTQKQQKYKIYFSFLVLGIYTFGWGGEGLDAGSLL